MKLRSETRRRSLVWGATIWSGAAALWVVTQWEPLPTVLLPIAASAWPLIVREPPTRAITLTATAIMAFFCLLGAMSVGILFVPSLIALAFATVLSTSIRQELADRTR